jgi:hypothetical protein
MELVYPFRVGILLIAKQNEIVNVVKVGLLGSDPEML